MSFYSLAHRALPDVEAMEKLFITTDLKNLLSSLPARCAVNQLQLWREQKEQRNRTSALMYSLGKGVSVLQAKRLDTLKLSYEALTDIRILASSDEDFKKQLL